ncbi:MAG: hypothetical protein WBG17_06340 [Burkholderiaceae bacterium]
MADIERLEAIPLETAMPMIEGALGAHPAVQLCAAVGAPDAYAVKLPVGFVTLVPGAGGNVGELVAFTAKRVDDGSSKPKSMDIIDDMAMTNVAKIYKLELRVAAAVEVARNLVQQVGEHLGVAPTEHPVVETNGEGVLQVVFDAASAHDAESSFNLQLHQELARSPWRTEFLSRRRANPSMPTRLYMVVSGPACKKPIRARGSSVRR